MESQEDQVFKPEERDSNMDTIDSNKTESSESQDTVSSLKRELREFKCNYEKEIAILEQKIKNYELEKIELIQAKEQAQKMHSDVLAVRFLSFKLQPVLN
jgi:GTPase involved in cell partitioning and DNA repair